MMNGTEEFAKLFKERDNPPLYTPIYGTVEELPEIKIRYGDKILLTEKQLTSLINLRERNIDGEYIHLKKKVAMLPYNNNNNYLILGVIYSG